MLLNCGVGEDCWESLGCKEIQPVHLKGDQSWVFIGRTDVEAETPVPWSPNSKNWLIWKDPVCWERLKAGGEGDDRGWGGWMASPTQWTWILVNSGSWWWTGRPGMLQSMGSQRVRDNWVTELNNLNVKNSYHLMGKILSDMYMYNWSSNNTGLDCTGLLRHGFFFSMVYMRFFMIRGWLNLLWMWNHGGRHRESTDNGMPAEMEDILG